MRDEQKQIPFGREQVNSGFVFFQILPELPRCEIGDVRQCPMRFQSEPMTVERFKMVFAGIGIAVLTVRFPAVRFQKKTRALNVVRMKQDVPVDVRTERGIGVKPKCQIESFYRRKTDTLFYQKIKKPFPFRQFQHGACGGCTVQLSEFLRVRFGKLFVKSAVKQRAEFALPRQTAEFFPLFGRKGVPKSVASAENERAEQSVELRFVHFSSFGRRKNRRQSGVRKRIAPSGLRCAAVTPNRL